MREEKKKHTNMLGVFRDHLPVHGGRLVVTAQSVEDLGSDMLCSRVVFFCDGLNHTQALFKLKGKRKKSERKKRSQNAMGKGYKGSNKPFLVGTAHKLSLY